MVVSMRYRRDRTAGASYFFTVVTNERRPIFNDEIQVDHLRDVLRQVRNERPFVINAIVVLPDHVHALWTLPNDDADYSTRWQMIKARFSRRSGRSAWQGRFWEHRIRNDDDCAKHIDYIHWNPVKHGLVTKPHDWQWSSFHKFQKNGYYGAFWQPQVEPTIVFGKGNTCE
jgi:putative transposase